MSLDIEKMIVWAIAITINFLIMGAVLCAGYFLFERLL